MIINRATLSAVFTGLKTTWSKALETVEDDDIRRLMEEVPSETASEDYPVASLLGDLEEVLDEVTITNIGVWLQNVRNRTYARIVEVKRDDIADDNIGVYRPGVRTLARRAALYPLRLAVEALLSAFEDEWVDGEAVFSADHVWPNNEDVGWSNLLDLALTADNLETAIQNIETRSGPAQEEGADPGDDAILQPLGLSADLLVCGPANRSTAEQILEAQYLANGGTNRNYQKLDLMVLSRLGDSEAWFVADSDPVRPMVLQNREGPEFTAREDPDDSDAFYRERYGYKGRRRCAVAIIAPWLIEASTGG